jgi:hypothetical protein
MKIHPDYKTISVTRIIIGAIILSTLAVTNIYLYKTLIEYKQILEFTTQENKDLQAKYLEARKELDRPLHYIDMLKLNEIVASGYFEDKANRSMAEKQIPGIQYVGEIESVQTDGRYIKVLVKSHYIDKNGKDLSDIPGYGYAGSGREGEILKDGEINFNNPIKLSKRFIPHNSIYFKTNNE